MAGRPKQPLSVIQGKKRSNHLTKKAIKEREEQEAAVKGYTDKVEPPDYLTEKQKKEFVDLAKELMRLEIFSNLDIDFLARYIDSRDQYIRLVKMLRAKKEKELKEDFDEYAKIQRSKNLLFNECKAAATELGLSITSRLKLVIPKNEEKPKSEFEKKFGDV